MTNPIKIRLKNEIWPILLVVIAIAASAYFYAHFPDRVASHWNFQGVADSYSSRATGAFTIPALILGMYFLFLIIPYFDPKRERYQEFAGVYYVFRFAIMALLLVIYLASGLFNLGYPVQIGVVVPVAIGIMFIVMGNYMSKLKFNWFIGIRTPWTLSSETVWNKTHRVGGWAFVILGIIMIIMPYLPGTIGMIIFFAAMAVAVIGSFLYSYIIFRQEQKAIKK